MIRPRLDPDALAPVPHGGPAGNADEGLPAVALDFSSNINAYGPAPCVLAAIQATDPAAYPDPDDAAPRRAAAELWGLPFERTLFGPGAAELVHRIARTYLAAGDRALIAAPAFGEYARAARGAGAEVVEARSCGGRADPPIDDVIARVRALRPRLVFVASPSSPLGAPRADGELERLAETVAPTGLLVLDEAYRSFAVGRLAPPTLPEHDTVVHVRSITKDCALAGLRAAFLVASPAVVRALAAAAPPWATSAPAQRAATAALSTEGAEHVERTVRELATARVRLARRIAALGYAVPPSVANYLCARVGAAGECAATLRRRGVRVRDCASFGLPDTIRVAVRTPRENDRLLDHLREAGCRA